MIVLIDPDWFIHTEFGTFLKNKQRFEQFIMKFEPSDADVCSDSDSQCCILGVGVPWIERSEPWSSVSGGKKTVPRLPLLVLSSCEL